MLAALDNHGTDAESRADTGADCRADRSAGNDADERSRSGRAADFYNVAFDRRFAFDRAFRDTLDVIVFDGQNFGQNRAEVTPATFRKNDAVKRKQHFRAAFDSARLLNF